MARGAPKPLVEHDGIVVGRHDFGEADRIVRLLTAEHGRVGVMARGARADRSRWAGLDLGVRARVRTRHGGGELETLAEVEVMDPRLHIRGSLARLALAAYACELCGALAREAHAEPRLFGLLETTLLLLDAAQDDPKEAFRAAIEAKALTFAGVAPVLDRCVACSGAPDAVMLFSASAGGILHRRCVGEEQGTRPVTDTFAAALERARRERLADQLDRGMPPGPDVLYDAIVAHVGRGLQSRGVLEQVG